MPVDLVTKLEVKQLKIDDHPLETFLDLCSYRKTINNISLTNGSIANPSVEHRPDFVVNLEKLSSAGLTFCKTMLEGVESVLDKGVQMVKNTSFHNFVNRA